MNYKNKMALNEFMNNVASAVSLRYPSLSITIKEVTKPNIGGVHGLLIADRNLNVAPTLYLEDFYKSYLYEEKTMAEIISAICLIYDKNKPQSNIDTSFLCDWNKVKGNIAVKLINYERNEKFLKEVPHIKILDLAEVFYYIVTDESRADYDSISTITITNYLMDCWGMTPNVLHQVALQNLPDLLGCSLKSMYSVLSEFMPDYSVDCEDADEPKMDEIYILTNERKLNGAANILRLDVLKNSASRMKSNLFILPSSVHEVLLVPDRGQSTVEELTEMVMEVNRTQLEPREFLSDNVYYYDRVKEQISIPLSA